MFAKRTLGALLLMGLDLVIADSPVPVAEPRR